MASDVLDIFKACLDNPDYNTLVLDTDVFTYILKCYDNQSFQNKSKMAYILAYLIKNINSIELRKKIVSQGAMKILVDALNIENEDVLIEVLSSFPFLLELNDVYCENEEMNLSIFLEQGLPKIQELAEQFSFAEGFLRGILPTLEPID